MERFSFASVAAEPEAGAVIGSLTCEFSLQALTSSISPRTGNSRRAFIGWFLMDGGWLDSLSGAGAGSRFQGATGE